MKTTEMNIMTLENLQYYDGKIKQYITDADAKAIKSVALSGNTLKFYKVENPTTETIPAYSIDLPETDLSNLLEKFNSATAGDVVTINADGKTITDSGVKLSNLATKSDVEAVDNKVNANTSAIDAINNTNTGILAQAKAYADTKDETIAAAKKSGDDAQADIDALVDKVGEVPADKTVVQMISDAQTAATYDDTQVKADIKKNTDAIKLLNDVSSVEGSVDYKIAQAVAKIMENPDETMNSINELVTWCNAHATEALVLTNKVTANENAISALEELVGETDVAQQITDAITAALKIDGVDKYALAADLTSAIGRIVALETKSHEHANKTVIDGITSEKVSTWDSAEQNAKNYADSLATNYATTEQGEKADSALQKDDIATGNGNGTISVKGEDVAVKGLGSAAYSNTNNFEVAGSVKTLSDGQVTTNKNDISTLKTKVEALESITYVEISDAEIDALFD